MAFFTSQKLRRINGVSLLPWSFGEVICPVGRAIAVQALSQSLAPL